MRITFPIVKIHRSRAAVSLYLDGRVHDERINQTPSQTLTVYFQ